MEKDNNKTTKYLAILFVIVFSFFIAGVSQSYRKVREKDYLTHEEFQDTILVEHPISNRGGTTYHDNKVVSSKSLLIENSGNFDDWRFRSKTNPSFHVLDDLDGPYYMYKAANNDTIVVIKDGYVLKFKMPITKE